jgi:hypothetical protein
VMRALRNSVNLTLPLGVKRRIAYEPPPKRRTDRPVIRKQIWLPKARSRVVRIGPVRDQALPHRNPRNSKSACPRSPPDRPSHRQSRKGVTADSASLRTRDPFLDQHHKMWVGRMRQERRAGGERGAQRPGNSIRAQERGLIQRPGREHGGCNEDGRRQVRARINLSSCRSPSSTLYLLSQLLSTGSTLSASTGMSAPSPQLTALSAMPSLG